MESPEPDPLQLFPPGAGNAIQGMSDYIEHLQTVVIPMVQGDIDQLNDYRRALNATIQRREQALVDDRADHAERVKAQTARENGLDRRAADQDRRSADLDRQEAGLKTTLDRISRLTRVMSERSKANTRHFNLNLAREADLRDAAHTLGVFLNICIL
jgi:hypothetical protein